MSSILAGREKEARSQGRCGDGEYSQGGLASKVLLKRLRRTSGGKAGKKVLLGQS